MVLMTPVPPAEAAFYAELEKSSYLNVVMVPAELKEIREASLPFSHQGENYGQRGYGFVIQPGECLKLSFSSIAMKEMEVLLGVPPTSHPMLQCLMKINRMPKVLRMREMKLPNTTTEPQTVVLQITGRRASNYKVMVERSKI